jgi:hypothetical protein
MGEAKVAQHVVAVLPNVDIRGGYVAVGHTVLFAVVQAATHIVSYFLHFGFVEYQLVGH